MLKNQTFSILSYPKNTIFYSILLSLILKSFSSLLLFPSNIALVAFITNHSSFSLVYPASLPNFLLSAQYHLFSLRTQFGRRRSPPLPSSPYIVSSHSFTQMKHSNGPIVNSCGHYLFKLSQIMSLLTNLSFKHFKVISFKPHITNLHQPIKYLIQRGQQIYRFVSFQTLENFTLFRHIDHKTATSLFSIPSYIFHAFICYPNITAFFFFKFPITLTSPPLTPHHISELLLPFIFLSCVFLPHSPH